MAHAKCEEHGLQPAERVTRKVIDVIRGRTDYRPGIVIPITLLFEDLEYPGYGTEEDRGELSRMGGVWESAEECRFVDESAMENALGLFTAVCTKCLAEVR